MFAIIIYKGYLHYCNQSVCVQLELLKVMLTAE